MAQLSPTRATRPGLYEVPIGRMSLLVEEKPMRSQPTPGRFGSLSSKTVGNTFQIQYGRPTRSSVPIEPYLK